MLWLHNGAPWPPGFSMPPAARPLRFFAVLAFRTHGQLLGQQLSEAEHYRRKAMPRLLFSVGAAVVALVVLVASESVQLLALYLLIAAFLAFLGASQALAPR